MPGSHDNSESGRGIWPQAAAVSATQALILLALAIAAFFCIDWALGASRSRSVSSGDAPVSAAGDCPQLAETFDRQRAACLQRRWSAVRGMRPWAPQNAALEDCMRSSSGEIAVPFKTNSCGNPKPSRVQRAQN